MSFVSVLFSKIKYWIIGLILVGLCVLPAWLLNRRLFADPDPEDVGLRVELPRSRSVIEFRRDIFKSAVELSDWAELHGNELRPVSESEAYFRDVVNANRLCNTLEEEYPGIIEWEDDKPAVVMSYGESRDFLLVPTWVLWAFHDELQQL